MKEPKIRFKGFCGEWEKNKLSHMVYSISSGKDTPSKGNFPLYGSTGIIGTVCSPSHSGPLLLVARVGANAGHIQLVDEECGITDNTLIVCPKAETLLDYLYYFFQQLNLNKLVYGSGQPLITGGMLKNIDVRVGSEDESQLLTIYFQHLDTLIQSTTKKIESLKQVKAASLQSMFPQEGETKPRVRFKGFEGEWEKLKADEIFKAFNEKNFPHLPVLSATQDRGMVMREEIGYNIFHDKSNEKTYKHILPGQFVIHLRSFQGGFAHSSIEGIASPAYTVMEFKNKSRHSDLFWKYIFMSKEFIKRLELITYGIRDGRSISFEEFSDMYFFVPFCEEQTAIASYLTNLDTQITLQTQRLEKLKQIKSACLDNMFV
ncbi:MAG: restriction endonuclease subunit S [Prevotella sp.]|nr:restriction endonuclease subunit S [Prevotella sp.]